MPIIYGGPRAQQFKPWAPSDYVPVFFPLPQVVYPPQLTGKTFQFIPQHPATYSPHWRNMWKDSW